MPADGGDRRTLAAAQAALVRALLGDAEVPPGFEPARLRATARVLLDKRLRAVTSACPELRRELGDRLSSAFGDYARSAPLPDGEGGVADASRFLRWLSARDGPLCDDLRAAAMRLALRRRPGVALVWLSEQRRLLAGIRAPATGRPRFVSIALRW